MELTLILGDRLVPKHAAIQAAVDSAHVDRRIVQVLSIDTAGEAITPHANPDYVVRAAHQRRLWNQVRKSIRETRCDYSVVICSAFGETDSGPELILPFDILRAVLKRVCDSGGTSEVVCLIDDLFAKGPRDRADMERTLTIRQLEWTFAQYLTSQFRGMLRPRVSCFSAHHPVTNLSSVIFRLPQISVYLCYPINFFRRNPEHPLKSKLDEFRTWIASSGLTVYDPLAIDEEAIISNDLHSVSANCLQLRSVDRWFMPGRKILGTESEFETNQLGITISPPPSSKAQRQAKNQIPQRDFFWIESADVVISWRPFLGNVHHAGVLSELQFALHKDKPIIAFSPVEDGSEHPSPFASMVSTERDESAFLRAIENLKLAETKIVKEPPKYCDHTSVGVIIYNEKNEILLIERGTFPYGMAIPAGHVDQHASYEEAAVAEVHEEVGLSIEGLRLVAEGRRENPCRRLNGSWHYWKVFEAKAFGTIRLNRREAKAFEWCSIDRVRELGIAAANQKSGTLLEKVWLDWFRELRLVDS